MKFTLRIKRFDPEKGEPPAFRDYELDLDPADRVLDALQYVKTYIDGSLAMRRSCAHGVCGSDAMVINGTERLACKTLVQQVVDTEGGVVTVEPLRTLPVQKDLMVDQAPFFEKYRSVKPFLINGQPVTVAPDGASKERLQSPKERADFEDPTRCILCAACYSACPVVQTENPAFIGPAAIVNAARFVFDSRDQGLEERLPALDDPNGVWACKNYFFCTKVCPRDIKVTKNINQTKRRIENHKKGKS